MKDSYNVTVHVYNANVLVPVRYDTGGMIITLPVPVKFALEVDGRYLYVNVNVNVNGNV